MKAPSSTDVVEKVSGFLGRRFGRRGFFARSAVVGSAIAVNPVTYALKPTTAYAAICSCNGSNCECGSLCCDGYTEFCCTIYGDNKCPPNTLLGGWWKADGTAFCGGPRYYMDCNAPCNGCGCGGNGICSGSCSGTGCGCANGSCGNRKAGCTQFRYGQCNQGVPCLGPIVCRVVTCVPPWSLDPSCTTTLRIDQNTAGHDRPCLHKVVGNLEDAVEDAGAIRVAGWALDFDTQGPVTVQAVVDGVVVASVVADGYRPDVGAAYRGWGDNHGFSMRVPIPAGQTKTICVNALNAGAGAGSTQLGCRTVRLNNPFGSLDSLTAGAGTIKVAGWAIDPDTTAAVKVHVYVDGQFRGEYTANQNRPDVGAAYPGFGSLHGYSATISVTGGTRNVCVYAINVGAGSTNPVLGCRSIEVGRPFGSVDRAVAVASGLRVTGWAIDPDTVDPIKVHVYVDSQFRGEFVASQPRPDVAAVHPEYGPAHGFDVNVLAGPGARRVDVWAINTGGGANPLLGTRTVNVIGGNPIGSLDTARNGPDSITVTGWAIDPDDANPAKVHVYVDGQFRGEFPADQPRPDVARFYPGYGSNRGFAATVPAAAGARSVCVFAINSLSGTTNPVLGCRTVQVGGNPIGALESASGGTGQVRVVGWALDPDTAGPAEVHVYVDGVFAGVGTAGVTRPEIGAFFPGFGADHGFDLVVPAPRGTRTVGVFAINTGAGSTNPFLGSRTVSVA